MTTINFESNGTFSGPVYAVDGVTITGSANVVDGGFSLGIQGGADYFDSMVDRGETIVFAFDSGAAIDVSYNLNVIGDGLSVGDGDNDSILGEATIEAFGVDGNSLGTVEQVGTFNSINVSQLFGGVAISKFQITGIDFFGIRQLSFTPTILNNPPTATNDSNTTNENTAVTGNVITNDTDPDSGDTLSVSAVNGNTASVGNQITLASGALLTLNSNGTYSYNPNGKFESLGAGQTGSDSFTYTVSDGNGGTSDATVTVNITGVNDAPTGSPTATLSNGTEDTNYTITAASLLQGFTDVDGDTLSVSNLTATNGALVNNNNGTYTFTPNANYNGVVNLTYGVTDGTATLAGQTRSFSITPVNDAPVAVNDSTTAFQNTAVTIAASSLLANDSDVDSPASSLRITSVSGATNGTVALNNNGTPTNFADDFIVFTPNNGFSGNGSFSYTLSDGSLTSTATVQVVVGKNINGGNNNDNLTGTAGNDVINGQNGQDTIYGLGSDDRIDGGNGDDKLYGGDGKDTLLGGNGQDQLWGDAGDDILTGGLGGDTFVLGNNLGVDTITDFSLGQGDKIGLLDGLTFNQLTLSGNQILLGSQVLAVVTGFNTNTLTAANFVSVSESLI